jgi:hypothetical protein
MPPATKLTHEFVDFIPTDLRDGVLYVSIAYATATHRCCCGCGREVVTPLTPTDWKMIYDGETISLDPSIGNWSFPCQSHYWIRRNSVQWAGTWSRDQINIGRARDQATKKHHFEAASSSPARADPSAEIPASSVPSQARSGRWRAIVSRWWAKRRRS